MKSICHTSEPASLHAGSCMHQGRCEGSKLWIFGACFGDSLRPLKQIGNGVRCPQCGCDDLLSCHGHISAIFLLALADLSTQSLWGKDFLF